MMLTFLYGVWITLQFVCVKIKAAVSCYFTAALLGGLAEGTRFELVVG